MHLAEGSDLIDSGTDLGLPYSGSAPDLGAFEFGEILPVELVSFTAVVSDKSIILKWITSSELNNKGFEIQKKFDNEIFLTIGFVPGAGTTTQSNEYSFITEFMEQGPNIFRLNRRIFRVHSVIQMRFLSAIIFLMNLVFLRIIQTHLILQQNLIIKYYLPEM